MRSMTGFGRGTSEHEGNRVTVEVSAVNSKKQCDVRCSLPREVSSLEPIIRQQVQRRLNRGTITVAMTYELSSESREATVHIDAQLAKQLAVRLQAIARDAGIVTQIAMSDVLLLPGVVTEGLGSSAQVLEPPLLEALSYALNTLRQMQEREGEELHKDLSTRYGKLQEISGKIAARADEVLQHHRNRLMERMALLGVDLALDEERLAREAAFLAERSDINEETVRLESHLAQLREKMEEEECGRALEFIAQELSREISTICAKSAETGLSQLGLAFKNELGKLREQILNVE